MRYAKLYVNFNISTDTVSDYLNTVTSSTGICNLYCFLFLTKNSTSTTKKYHMSLSHSLHHFLSTFIYKTCHHAIHGDRCTACAAAAHACTDSTPSDHLTARECNVCQGAGTVQCPWSLIWHICAGERKERGEL